MFSKGERIFFPKNLEQKNLIVAIVYSSVYFVLHSHRRHHPPLVFILLFNKCTFLRIIYIVLVCPFALLCVELNNYYGMEVEVHNYFYEHLIKSFPQIGKTRTNGVHFWSWQWKQHKSTKTCRREREVTGWMNECYLQYWRYP